MILGRSWSSWVIRREDHDAGGRGVRSPADALFGPAATAAAGFRLLDSQPNLLLLGAPAEPEVVAGEDDAEDLAGADEED